MKRLVIAIDCDDVLVSTARDLIDFYNKKYGTNIDETDFYAEPKPERIGVATFQEAIERLNERLMMADHQAIAPSEEAVAAVRRLSNHHELHIVTGRPHSMERATIEMVNKYFPNCFASIEHTNFISVDKDAIKRSKSEVCLAINADVLIDDYIEHIRDVLKAGVPHALVFGDFDWGKRGTLPVGAVRCSDWFAIEREVDRLARQ